MKNFGIKELQKVIKPYHMQFESKYINWKLYENVFAELRKKYPHAPTGKIRAHIFNAGLEGLEVPRR